MKYIKFVFSIAAAFCATFAAQISIATQAEFSPPIFSKKWNASWAGSPEADAKKDCTLQFRRSFELKQVPESFKVNVSADNRFILYVNGELAGRGPARGDLQNWRYHTIDIARHLKPGKNVLSALVWDLGELAPMAQIGKKLSFILDGATEKENFLATPKGWKVKKNTAINPGPMGVFGYVGCGDDIDAAKIDDGWTLPQFDDSDWKNAVGVEAGMTSSSPYGEFVHMLRPSPIPQMEETPVRFKSVRRSSGIEVPDGFLSGGTPLKIPPNTVCRILFDNGELTNAYPVLRTRSGAGSTIKIRYAEALFDKNKSKANRNDIEGRDFEPNAHCDIFRPASKPAVFSTRWFRTYRYAGMEIQTAGEPLIIEDFSGIFTGYPFVENAYFKCDDASAADIWKVGWRTARLCAHETYFDCPYYEQLQYIGDTRIQALISLYVSGDDRLMRNALTLFDISRSFDGITQSRYPSRRTQFIPPFCLYWISMLHDYAMHRDDDAFVRPMLGGVRTALEWYFDKIDPDTGMLAPKVPHWNFADWTNGKGISGGWFRGTPPEGKSAGSAINTLHLAYALRHASELMRRFGDEHAAKEYDARRAQILKSVADRCFDAERGIFVNYEGSNGSSQHVNIMAILTDAIAPQRQPELMKKILSDKSLAQCTFYYRFYLAEAMRKTGMGDLYMTGENLKPWRDMIDRGLTTFAETPEPARSDCHAWSSSPNYHFLSLVAGVTPAEFGFKSANIEPRLGNLNALQARAMHPKGEILLDLKRDKNAIKGTVTLPPGIPGTFKWNGKQLPLNPGENTIAVE